MVCSRIQTATIPVAALRAPSACSPHVTVLRVVEIVPHDFKKTAMPRGLVADTTRRSSDAGISCALSIACSGRLPSFSRRPLSETQAKGLRGGGPFLQSGKGAGHDDLSLINEIKTTKRHQSPCRSHRKRFLPLLKKTTSGSYFALWSCRYPKKSPLVDSTSQSFSDSVVR